MSARKPIQVVPAVAVNEGAGVIVYRSLGTRARRHLDPFLLLDQFNSTNPDDYIAGFPDHPHRGFNTFTYMLDGHMQHQDSMGNRGQLGPGDAQWMKAGSGVIHSEMPQQAQGRMRGFQLWINLPAELKMTAPEYHELRSSEIPLIDTDGVVVRLLVGEWQGQCGALLDPVTHCQYLDVSMPSGKQFEWTLPQQYNAFIYVIEGCVSLADTSLQQQQLAVLGEGEQVLVHAKKQQARLLLVAGMPINQPIVQHGPYVMNSREEIQQALDDYRLGRLVRSTEETTA